MKLSTSDARGISIGVEFAVGVILGLGAGFWLDRHFHTSPWCTLAGVVLGFTAGIRSLLKLAADANRDAERDAPGDPPSNPPSGDPSDPK